MAESKSDVEDITEESAEAPTRVVVAQLRLPVATAEAPDPPAEVPLWQVLHVRQEGPLEERLHGESMLPMLRTGAL